MKIDVEGFEDKVLMGAVETIRTQKPFILMESFEDSFERDSHILENEGYYWEAISPYDYLFIPDSVQ